MTSSLRCFVMGIIFSSGLFSAEVRATGDWSSGGGDVLTMIFREAKVEAAMILRQLKRETIEKNLANTEPSIVRYLAKYKDTLAKDLSNSPLEFHDEESDSWRKCARTIVGQGPMPIRIYLRNCFTVKGRHDAILLLIHETFHHLVARNDEKTEKVADKVAIAALKAWEHQQEMSLSYCPGHLLAWVGTRDKKRLLEISFRDAQILTEQNVSFKWLNPLNHIYGEWTSDGSKALNFEFKHKKISLNYAGINGRCVIASGHLLINRSSTVKKFPFIVLADDFTPVVFLWEPKPGKKGWMPAFNIIVNPGENLTPQDDSIFITHASTNEWYEFQRKLGNEHD